jgi:hypothetical protein
MQQVETKGPLLFCAIRRFREQSASLAACFMLISFLAYSSNRKWRKHAPAKRPLTFNGLHSVMSQKLNSSIRTLAFFTTDVHFLVLYVSCLYLHFSYSKSFSASSSNLNLGLLTFLIVLNAYMCSPIALISLDLMSRHY